MRMPAERPQIDPEEAPQSRPTVLRLNLDSNSMRSLQRLAPEGLRVQRALAASRCWAPPVDPSPYMPRRTPVSRGRDSDCPLGRRLFASFDDVDATSSAAVNPATVTTLTGPHARAIANPHSRRLRVAVFGSGRTSSGQ